MRFNAKSAYISLDEIKPDIIVSDAHARCRRIPISAAWLSRMWHTAISPWYYSPPRHLVDDQVRGLHDGANAYVTKPFDPEYLLALIQSQLQNQKNLRDALEHATQTDNIDSSIISSSDTSFMRELYALMENKCRQRAQRHPHHRRDAHLAHQILLQDERTHGYDAQRIFKTYKPTVPPNLILEGKYIYP